MNKKRPLCRGLSLALLIFSAGVHAACSRSEPKISFGFIELVYYQTEKGREERFSFFVIPDNEEGVEDLDQMYLYHDREQLRWDVASEDWICFVNGETTWIGSRALSMPEQQRLPRGQFRAVLVNKGGERSERLFTFDAPEESRFPFPGFALESDAYRVDSKYPKNQLVCYDAQGNFVKIQEVRKMEGLVRELGLPPEAKTAALWAEDPDYSVSAFTGAVRIP